MAGFPAAGYITDAARIEGEVKTAFDDWLATTKQIPGAAVAETTLTISSGSVTPTQGIHAVDTEAAAATDDLTNIVQTNLPDGSLLLLHTANAARDITVKHSAGGAGQISLRNAVDLVLATTTDYLLLRRNGALWEEVLFISKSLDRIPVIAKTGAYAVVIDDNGKLIDATSGTWTLSLLAAASAADGFTVWLKVGTGTITVDPNSSEQIDGSATKAFGPGSLAQIVCTGSAWRVAALWAIGNDNSWTGANSFKKAYSALYAIGNSSLDGLTPDMANGNVQTITATASGTMVTPANASAGTTLILKITQDGTGSRVVTWPSTFKWPGGTAGVLSTAAGAVDVLTGVYDGTNWSVSLQKAFS